MSVTQILSRPMQVFNTHTCANYAHSYGPAADGVPWVVATDLDAPIRVAQVLQLARFVRTLRDGVSRPPLCQRMEIWHERGTRRFRSLRHKAIKLLGFTLLLSYGSQTRSVLARVCYNCHCASAFKFLTRGMIIVESFHFGTLDISRQNWGEVCGL